MVSDCRTPNAELRRSHHYNGHGAGAKDATAADVVAASQLPLVLALWMLMLRHLRGCTVARDVIAAAATVAATAAAAQVKANRCSLSAARG